MLGEEILQRQTVKRYRILVKMKIFIVLFLLYKVYLPIYQHPDLMCHGRSFTDFAYGDPWTVGLNLKPDNSWKIVSEIPSSILEPVNRPEEQLLRLLFLNQNHIWIGSIENRFLESPILFRFDLKTNLWEKIPIFTINGSDRIFKVFQDNQNQVWGVTDNPEIVLARFDEEKRMFVGIHHIKIDNIPEKIPIVITAEEDLWIFTYSGAIYRYSYRADKLIIEPQSVKLPLIPSDAVYHSDGYFVIRMSTGLPGNGRITDEELTYFYINQQEMIALDVPDEWPTFLYMQFDSDGTLWFGTTGYVSVTGEWNLIHPNPQNYFSKYYSQGAQPPHLNLISSDGRLWFDKYVDMGYQYEGTAWYDPNSGEGCMFTTYPSHVVEGKDSDLWILVDGNLYTLDISS